MSGRFMSKIFIQWGTQLWDLFVSQTNRKRSLYCSRVAMGCNSQGDSLLMSWMNGSDMSFLPFPCFYRS